MNHADQEVRNALIKSDFENGERNENTAKKHGVTASHIRNLARIFNWENAKTRKRKPRTTGFLDLAVSNISKPETRNADMVTAYRSGLTLQQIGDQHNVTRERVRQIMKKFGIAAMEGGRSIKRSRTESKRAKQIEYNCFAKYGVSRALWADIGANARQSWREQKRTSVYRGVKFDLSLADWWAIWQESGKWDQRGRGADRYCMARVEDAGGYKLGNVYITTIGNNGREYQKHKTVANGSRGGVYCMYPGYTRPWMAKFSKRFIGLYVTEAEARSARADYLAANNLPKPTKTRRATHVPTQQVAA